LIPEVEIARLKGLALLLGMLIEAFIRIAEAKPVHDHAWRIFREE
jgi:hypothetical protein